MSVSEKKIGLMKSASVATWKLTGKQKQIRYDWMWSSSKEVSLLTCFVSLRNFKICNFIDFY